MFESLRYDRLINLAVMFGVLCTAAVLTGALLVGDSMKGSLRDLTLDRLGNVDTILFAPNYIEVPDFVHSEAEAVIYLSAAAEYNGNVCGTQILGIKNLNSGILNRTSNTSAAELAGEFIVNQSLADKLGVRTGGELSLRFLSPQSIPPESALGRKDHLIRTKVNVGSVTANLGIGRFSLKASQQAEPLIIVPLNWLQKKLNVRNKVNAVFLNSRQPAENWQPSLDALGINVTKNGNNFYITSSRLLFTQNQAAAIRESLSNTQSGLSQGLSPGLLYLASSIKAVKNGKEVPYSTVYAGEVYGGRGEPVQWKEKNSSAGMPIVLNQWTAENLDVQCGDKIELTWFEPDNVNVTKTQKFTLIQIIEETESHALLVPEVKGLTDKASIGDWDPPFPFDAKKIRKADEAYWDKFGAAPKAFVSLSAGQQFFGSRFGTVTTFISATPLSADNFAADNLTVDKAALFGLNFVPVKALGLAASRGTTPFSVLFLSFSFFIIVSALMLVLMLFRLSVEMKAEQIGIRLAAGWTPFAVMKLLLCEGFLISVTGSLLGVLFGIFYARLMIYGLSTLWLGAVSVPFLTLHVTSLSLILGFTGTLITAMLTIALSLRKIVKKPVKQLLNGNRDTAFQTAGICGKALFVFSPLKSLFRLAVSNASRNRTRSLLCIVLIASTVFLLLTIGVFHIEPAEKYTGGIEYIAETAFPVYADIAAPEGREQLSMQQSDEKLFAQKNVTIFPFRLKDGDSADCLNLYQTNQPRVLGAPKTFIDRKHVGNTDWQKLHTPVILDPDGNRRVPVILDNNTAMYSLHLYGGIGSVYELQNGGETIRCEIAGLLNNSLLQGAIVMSEENLLQLFPETGGYRYFLFGGRFDAFCIKQMNDLLADYGFQGEPALDRLQKLFAVQNTYLAAFQSLGGAGLLLGVFGLAVIQVRNVFERRRELALLQALGFTQSRLILLLLYENLTLLFFGLALAAGASAAVLFLLFVTGQPAEISSKTFAIQLSQLAGSMIFIGIISNAAAAFFVLKIPVARELAQDR